LDCTLFGVSAGRRQVTWTITPRIKHERVIANKLNIIRKLQSRHRCHVSSIVSNWENTARLAKNLGVERLTRLTLRLFGMPAWSRIATIWSRRPNHVLKPPQPAVSSYG
jgi:hypothetical protein